ncbi:MAG: c-type cytochrome [Thermodesulfobacteriota bacterium]
MKKRLLSFITFRSYAACLSVLFMASFVLAGSPAFAKGKDGKTIYENNCLSCHGVKGDSRSATAANLLVKPRNFTLGLYKFKSTPGDSLPTDDDLRKVIKNGLSGSSMPNFRLMSDADLNAVVGYIKSLSPRFANEKPGVAAVAPKIPGFVGTKASRDEGAKLFVTRCEMCHGSRASRTNVTFMLKWPGSAICNDRVRPADFTAGRIKRGITVEDIFMSITSGADNTPMLAFDKMLSEDERWHLVSYILEFMGKGGR